MPQKHPPASTAVSSPPPCAGASAAGGGMVTAGSACAVNGAAARAKARRNAGRLIMAGIQVNAFALIYGRSRPRASHILTRWRERDVFHSCPLTPAKTGVQGDHVLTHSV